MLGVRIPPGVPNFDLLEDWKGKKSSNRKTSKEILILRENGIRTKRNQLLRALIEENIPYECSECGLNNEWNNKELILPIDHKNGNWLDDRLENLRFLCPNCHSQTETYGNKKVR